MKFFANAMNGSFLRNVLPGGEVEVEWVKAAIAYGNDEASLVKNCIDHQRRLDIWMRYDHTVPVAPPLLRHLLKSRVRNVFCRLIPDVLHSKIIWWRGYGVYIGSANLTDRAWMTNIEFGAFISESELAASTAIEEIASFFDELDACEPSFDLSEEIIRELEAMKKARADLDSAASERAGRLRSVEVWLGPTIVANARSVIDRRRDSFEKEWRRGAALLSDIASLAPAYRPRWLVESVPPTWQADQFLHAYYYNQVVEGTAHPYEEFHLRNARDPVGATKSALDWWSRLPEAPSDEDFNCHERAPTILRLLDPKRLRDISEAELVDLFRSNHSSMDHVRRMTAQQLMLPHGDYDTEDRIRAFAHLIATQKNAQGQSLGELLAYVLDGGSADDMPSRLFDATADLAFPHIGKNQLAEIAGWARPEKYSPRNGRTSKALRALGYPVKVY